MAKHGALRKITREQIEPLWARRTMPISRIAEALGVSRQAVSYHAAKLGLQPRLGNYDPQKKGSDALFRKMWMANVPRVEMQKYFGFAHVSCVNQRRTMMGLPPRPRSGGSGGRSGWPRPMPIEEFLQMQLGEKMKAEAGRMKS